jgi:hypothetical protein
MLAIALKLLGIGKAILAFFLGLIKVIMEWAGKHPLLAAAIAVDIVLLYGCWWGYGQHRDSVAKSAEITQLHTEIKQKDGLIEMLYRRLKEYAVALTDEQNARESDIKEHNKAVEDLRKAGDSQLAAAQKKAEETKKQRDAYFLLSEKYRRVLSQSGNLTPAERIAREEEINRDFIREYQGVRKK